MKLYKYFLLLTIVIIQISLENNALGAVNSFDEIENSAETTLFTVSTFEDTCTSTTVADAGSDQTVCSTTSTLAGNIPIVGTGTWAVISGGASVTTPSDSTSEVTGLSIGDNLFQWMISNGVCPTTKDTVSITRNATPTAADAGPNQTVCSTASTLAGNTPIVGTGIWTVISGGATVTTPSDPTSGVTGLSIGDNLFEWMISNGVCATTRDTVSITRDAPPTTANAGTDQIVCSMTATFAGNTPTVGTGTWTVVSGSASVTTPSDPSSGVIGLSIGENMFEWMITNGVCATTRDTVNITRDAPPTTANAGTDQGVCITTATLAGNAPTVGIGTWIVIAGSGSVTTPSNPTSGVTGLSIGVNTFVWTISNASCPSSSDTVTITQEATPTTANAGPDQIICSTSSTLAGNTPVVGTGAWTMIIGSGSVTTPSSSTSGVTGLSVGANTIVWTISSPGCGSSNDTVTITREASPTTANAGSDQSVCVTTTTLAGNTPTVGVGTWTVIAGSAAITTSSSPTSGVTGLSVGVNTFVWTINNGSCSPSKDTVTITRNAVPTTSNAGVDQAICSTTSTLAGNTPTVGTGLWTVIAGSATLTTPSSPTSGLTGIPVGVNRFVWTISNGSCPPSRDTMTITRNAAPTTANAGSDQSVCAATATLAGNTPTVGTGAWTVIAGSATVTTTSSPTSGVTSLSVGTNMFMWSISNGNCPSSRDTITITRNAIPTTANAGSDQTVCSATATLAGNTPAIGTGLWSVIAGTGSVTTPTSPTSGVTGLSIGTNTFVWTISNGSCPPSRDTVVITLSTPISFSSTKTDVSCNGGNDGSITVTASGGIGTLTYSKDGGTTFQSSNVFNNLTAGTYNIVIRDASSCTSASQSVAITQPAVIVIAPATLPNGTIATLYNQTISATGGTPPHSFTVSGTLPPGLTLSLSGSLTGTPTVAGNYSFTVHDTDANTCMASKAYTITVNKKATTSILTQSSSLTLEGEIVTFKDSVSGSVPDGGTVQFKYGGIDLDAPVALDTTGVAILSTSSLPRGVHAITAVYSGTSNYESSTSNSITHAVAVTDTTKYRTASYEEWALAQDRNKRIKPVKRTAHMVDFKLNIRAPKAASGFTLAFNIHTRGVVTRGTAKLDTVTPATRWDSTRAVTYAVHVDSGETFQLDGRGFKGKFATVNVTWLTSPTLPRVTYKDPSRFALNLLLFPMPNLHNVGEELFPDGLGQPSPVFPNGLLVGVPLGNSAANSVLLTKYKDTQRSLAKLISGRNVLHTQGPKCMDVFNNGNPISKQQRYLSPDKHNNKLLGELLTLKLNIAASIVNKFPNGLGELTYNDLTNPSDPFNNMMVNEILMKSDTAFACLGLHPRLPVNLTDMYNIVRKINSAFTDGTIDTTSFALKTRFTGVRMLDDVAFLHKTQGIVPLSLPDLNVITSVPAPNYQLYQNYPNPFNPTTTIQFYLTEPATVTLKVYNMLGQEVATLFDEELMDEGTQDIEFDAHNLASGMYFYRMIAQGIGDEEEGIAGKYSAKTKKMLLVK